MSARTVVLAAVGAGCIAAAGVGGFLAMRLTVPARGAEASVAQASPAPSPRPPSGDTTGTAVVTPADTATPPVATPQPAETKSRAVEPKATTNDKPVEPSKPRTGSSQATQPPAPVAKAPASPPSAPAQQPPVTTPVVEPPPPPPPPDEPPPVQEPPKPRFDELTVEQNSVIGIHLDNAVSSETARVEDKVTAHVTRDVLVAGRTAIPAGARLEGNVTLVQPGGKFKERARLGIKFTSLILADNTRQSIQTEALFRDGESPTGEATAKVGASAVIGTIVGAMIGGKKGAAIGSAAGAAGGTAAVAAGGRNEAAFAAGTPLTVRLTAPLTLMIERVQQIDRVPR